MDTSKVLFVAFRRYGATFDPRKPLQAQPDWEAHRAFMNALEAEGMVRLGGPLQGTDEVLLVFHAENPGVIEQRLAADPWTRSGILSTSRILPWDLRIGRISAQVL